MLDRLRSQAFFGDSAVFDAPFLRIFMLTDIHVVTFGAVVVAFAIFPYAQACLFLEPDLEVDGA